MLLDFMNLNIKCISQTQTNAKSSQYIFFYVREIISVGKEWFIHLSVESGHPIFFDRFRKDSFLLVGWKKEPIVVQSINILFLESVSPSNAFSMWFSPNSRFYGNNLIQIHLYELELMMVICFLYSKTFRSLFIKSYCCTLAPIKSNDFIGTLQINQREK